MNELRRVTSILEEFEINERKHRVIRIEVPKILDESLIQKLGKEILGYLATEGEEYQGFKLYDPRFSDSNSDYCVDFSNVEYISSAAVGKFVVADKRHREKRKGRGLCLAEMKKGIYEALKIMQLDGVFTEPEPNRQFNIFRTLEDYKIEMGRRAGVETVPSN